MEITFIPLSTLDISIIPNKVEIILMDHCDLNICLFQLQISAT